MVDVMCTVLLYCSLNAHNHSLKQPGGQQILAWSVRCACRCYTSFQFGTSGTDKKSVVLNSGRQLQKIDAFSVLKLFGAASKKATNLVCYLSVGIAKHCTHIPDLSRATDAVMLGILSC
jgi:hypothetical protein